MKSEKSSVWLPFHYNLSHKREQIMSTEKVAIFERKVKRLSDEIIKCIKKKKRRIRAGYLLNAFPKRKVEYIFITLEPSLRWARSEE
jgi:peptidoglycan/xylan/chitin deacetylase (PgdA/CDA1 family)